MQRGRGDDQHGAGLKLAGGRRWEEQAEVAVGDPARLQDLAVGVGAELCYWLPLAAGGWMGYRATRPGEAVDLYEPVSQACERTGELLSATWPGGMRPHGAGPGPH
jgi:hypothetical protein